MSMCSVAGFFLSTFDVCKTSLAVFLLPDPLDECNFKSAVESSRFTFRICFQFYSVELCSVHLKKKLVSSQIKIHELEHNLREQKQRIEQLECKRVSWKTSAVSGKRSRTPEGEVTSRRDISKKESCCSKYLGNGTVNSDDVLSSIPIRERVFVFWSRDTFQVISSTSTSSIY